MRVELDQAGPQVPIGDLHLALGQRLLRGRAWQQRRRTEEDEDKKVSRSF